MAFFNRTELEGVRKYFEDDVKATLNMFYGTSYFEIKKVIFNDPATIVLWRDGSKTVVKTQNGEKYDPEKGFAMAVAKKHFGNTGNYYDVFKKWVPYETAKEDEDETINIYGDGTLLAVMTPIKNPGPVKDYFDMGNEWTGVLNDKKYARVEVTFYISNKITVYDKFIVVPSGDKAQLNEAFNVYLHDRGANKDDVTVVEIRVHHTADTIYELS